MLQKSGKDHGRYNSMTEYGGSHSKGYVVIPTGRELWEWRDLYLKWFQNCLDWRIHCDQLRYWIKTKLDNRSFLVLSPVGRMRLLGMP